MKYIIIVLLALLTVQAFGSDNEVDIVEVRKLFYLSSESDEQSKAFLDLMSGVPDDSLGLRVGYLAMAYMLRAKYVWNPYNKLKYFSKGRELLERQIGEHSNSTELFFLRYCVQSNAPFFLSYSDKMTEDKAYIIRHYDKTLDKDLRWRIKKFFIDSKDLTKEEKQILSKELWTTM